ncbi:MAG: hypothetical protein ABI136_05990 [Ginsengibacter sp.]
MKTKQIFYGVLMAGILFVGLSGCSKGDKEEREPETQKVTINKLVVGQGNSKTVKLGEKIFIEADIIAKGKINRVLISLRSLEASIPVTISTTLDKDLKDKTEAHLKWDTLMDDVPTGKYQLNISVEAQSGEPGQISSEFSVLAK